MTSNKYLTKVAGLIDKSIRFADDLIGHSHGKLKQEAEILSNAEILGRTAKSVSRQASDAKTRMVKARVQAGLGATGIGAAGFLGVHKYHQHKDNAILAKIDRMYSGQHQQKGN